MRKYIGTWQFYKRLLKVALPVMAQTLIQNLVSLIDNFMVSGLGDIKMSGVNVAGQIFFIFFVLIGTLCSGGGIFMSQFKGAGNKEGMQQVFRFKIVVTGIVGIVFAVLSYIAPRGLYNLMVTTNKDASAILDQTQAYSRATSLSFVFAVFSTSIGSSLREIENVKAPLVISIAATLVNTFLNWVLIYGHLGAPRLEVVGAGYATCVARFVELAMFLIYIKVRKPEFMSKITKLFCIEKKLFIVLFSKSFAILYSELFWAISETVSNALYNTRGGAEVVSGMASGFAIANLIFISMGGIMTSTSVVLGQELGANHLEECKIYKNWILTGALIFGAAFGIIGYASTFLIPVVFGNLTVEARKIAFDLVVVCSAYLPLWGFLNGQFAIARTGGDTKMQVICDTVGNSCFLAGMFLLTYLTPLGPIAMYAIVKLSDVPKCVIAYFVLKKDRWIVNLSNKA